MIISDRHKYVFVELPLTGTTAISKELCLHYDGRPILEKHSPYHRFLEIADARQRDYFVFSGIRNPLDETVSQFFKKKTDHYGRYSNADNWAENNGDVSDWSLRRYRFIQENGADFGKYLRHFHRLPYDNWSCLDHSRFDYVIRFEHLADDFAKVLALLGIEPVRPLPRVHSTAERGADYLSYYPPDLVRHAIRVFGPFMQATNYELPPSWGNRRVPLTSSLLFRLLRVARRRKWRKSL